MYSKEYYQKNKERIKESQRKYYENNLEKAKQIRQNYRNKNKEKIKKINKEYSEANKEKIKKKNREYYIKNSEKIKAYSREWNKKFHKKRGEYSKKRRNENVIFKLHDNISNLMYVYLKKVHIVKSNKIEKLLGYSVKELKEHLESQFEDWMSWENHGKVSMEPKQTWQIDHIRPVNTFNITSEDCEDFKKCWALNNLRPLDSYINVRRPRDGSDEI